jgi:nucleotide-binding universal stress UspA family protein
LRGDGCLISFKPHRRQVWHIPFANAPPIGGDATMIKDIVVNLGVGERTSLAGDYAVSIAATFDAHVAGIAFVYDPIVPGSGAGYIPAEVFETQQRDNAAATKAALDRFAAASARAGVSAEPLTLSVSFASAGDQFGRIARRFDLAIVGQAEPETSAGEETFVQTLTVPWSVRSNRGHKANGATGVPAPALLALHAISVWRCISKRIEVPARE